MALLLWRIKDKIRDLKWFIQRGKHGYADCDIWNLNYYLAEVIINRFKKLKKSTNYMHPPECSSGEEWANIIDDIIKGFQAYERYADYMDPEYRVSGKREEWYRDFNKGMALLKQYWFAFSN